VIHVCSDPSLAITILVPTNAGVNNSLQPWRPGDAEMLGIDTQIALHNMLPAAYCPEELANAGSVGTLLGVLTNENQTLSFSRDEAGHVALATQQGPALIVDTWGGVQLSRARRRRAGYPAAQAASAWRQARPGRRRHRRL
jgi:hypothetical protein